MQRSPEALLRTAKFHRGEQELEHPVDVLGRAVSFTTLRANPIEYRDGIDQPIGFRGEAIAYNQRTWIGSKDYGYWEQIAPEAVTKTMHEADVRFLVNHDPNLLLARNRAGTLRLSSTMTGLAVDADMAPTSYARDLAISLARQDMNQMSFAFTPIGWRTEEADDGKELITFTELRLWDVSAVTYPAYDMTTAGLRGEAFDALCRAQQLDPIEVLRGYASGEPLPVPAEATRNAAPAETTRADMTPHEYQPSDGGDSCAVCGMDADSMMHLYQNSASPAETTERTHPNPGDVLRAHRAKELDRLFR